MTQLLANFDLLVALYTLSLSKLHNQDILKLCDLFTCITLCITSMCFEYTIQTYILLNHIGFIISALLKKAKYILNYLMISIINVFTIFLVI